MWHNFTKRLGVLSLFFALNLCFTPLALADTGCNIPTNIKYFEPTATTLTTYWDAVPEATAYQILMRVVGTSEWSINIRVPYNSTTIRNLSSRTEYEYVVSTICSSGQSGYCSILRFSTNVDCVPPININCGSITTTTAALSWGKVNGADFYTIEYKAANETLWRSVTTTNTSYTLTGLTPNTYYQYKICANCPACAAVECSPVMTFTTLISTTPTCGMPSNLIATNIGTTTATLNWSAVQGATSYQVRLRPVGVAGWTVLATSPTNSVNITGLQNNTVYEWTVQAICNGVESGYCSLSTFKTLPIIVCDPPTGLKVFVVTTNTAQLGWNTVASATKYVVEYKATGEITWRSQETGGNLITLTGLLPNTNYQFRVCAVCPGCNDYGCSGYCPFTTLPQASCGIPTNLDENNITTTSANLFWTGVSGATSYSVRIRVRGSNNWLYQFNTSNTSIVVSGLTANTTYEWSVQAVCGLTTGGYCDVGIFTTLPLPVCNAPTNLKVLSVSQTTAQLSWSAVSNAVRYIVEYRIANMVNSQIIETTNTTLTLSGLVPNMNYQFRICAVCADCATNGCSAWCPFTTLQYISCGTPTNLDETNITINSARLIWNAVPGATAYRIRIREVGTPYWSEGTVYNNFANASYLDPNTTYEWQVLAICNGIYGAYCLSSTFTTPGICGTPVNLIVTNITSTNATLNWSIVGYAIKYTVEYRASGDATWKRVETTGTSLTINNLTANTNYEFRVCAVCSGCIDPYCSAICVFKTLAPPCVAPTNLAVINITATGATFTWSAVPYATKYTVQYMPTNEANWRTVDVTTNSLTVNDLSPNVNYVFRVCTMCTGVNGSFCSANCFFKTLPPPCIAPTNLAVTNITTTGATLTWSAVQGISLYTVEYMLSTEPVWRSATTNTNSLTISGLSPNTHYIFRVCITCPGYTTPTCSSTCSFQTLQQSCGIPSNLLAYNISQTSACISWSAVAGATGYHVRVRSVNSSIWEDEGTVSSTTARVTDLDPGKTYVWQVAAICPYGMGSYCALSQFTTLAAPVVCLNDEACQSVNLVANSGLYYTNGTNKNATQTINPPFPTSCSCPSTAYDVWYKATIPSSGRMTITVAGEGIFDPVVAIYYGSSCSWLNYLTCKYDLSNPNVGGSPSVSLSGAPGIDIYIRVWGYNGTIGNFKIGVTNYTGSYLTSTNDNTSSSALIISNNNQKEVEQAKLKTGLGFDEVKVENPIATPSHATTKAIATTLKAYPNPAKQVLNVEYGLEEETDNVSITLNDVAGRIIYQNNSTGAKGSNNHTIRVDNFVNGFYLLKITDGKQQIVQKIQIAH